jgi:hypothetical protein
VPPWQVEDVPDVAGDRIDDARRSDDDVGDVLRRDLHLRRHGVHRTRDQLHRIVRVGHRP